MKENRNKTIVAFLTKVRNNSMEGISVETQMQRAESNFDFHHFSETLKQVSKRMTSITSNAYPVFGMTCTNRTLEKNWKKA